jgi:hypothetical protein
MCFIVYPGKTAQDVINYNSNKKFGVIIAGNAGRPLGRLSKNGYIDFSQINKTFDTQEESVLRYVILGLLWQGKSEYEINCIFKPILDSFGLPHNNYHTTITKQGFDYTKDQTTAPYNLAYTLKVGYLVLCWVFGPNANRNVGSPTGTMKRTFSNLAAVNYNYFVDCIYTSYRAAFYALYGKVDEVITTGLSSGVYAGPWKKQICENITEIMKNALSFTPFKKVHYPIPQITQPRQQTPLPRQQTPQPKQQTPRTSVPTCKTLNCNYPRRFDDNKRKYYNTCCYTCKKSNGHSHGPNCNQVNQPRQQKPQSRGPKCANCNRSKRFDNNKRKYYDTCCYTCMKSNGHSHGPYCNHVNS